MEPHSILEGQRWSLNRLLLVFTGGAFGGISSGGLGASALHLGAQTGGVPMTNAKEAYRAIVGTRLCSGGPTE